MIAFGQWDSYLSTLCEEFRNENKIPAELYDNQNVKRGLRNADGTGVVAGVSMIGNVHGYVMNEGERIPDEGRLTYRGISVTDMVESYRAENRFGFEETAFLLLIGRLPTKEELDKFRMLLGSLRKLPVNFTEDMIIKAPSNNVMNKLARATLALYSYDDNADDLTLKNNIRQGIELVARFPTIISHAYQVKKHYYNNESLVLHYPKPELSTAENTLMLMRQNGEYTDEEAKLLDLCLVLHAEHSGGNNSTFACRVLTSAGTDTYSAASAAVGSLKAPKHGGANIAVKRMFQDIMENVENWDDDDQVFSYLKRILRKEAGDGSGLIYGMGHAIYTLSDPRAVQLKKYARSLAEAKGFDRRMALIERVERLAPAAMAEERGQNKVICANVDLYSGLVYEMLDIPEELYTPLFAVSRITGWIAHRLEELENGGRIIRPAYKPVRRRIPYIPLEER